MRTETHFNHSGEPTSAGEKQPQKDYYQILGVNRTADNQTVKTAYRQMALKFHPDRNPGDKAAEEKFKEAAEAYAILSDGQKRAEYDQYGFNAKPYQPAATPEHPGFRDVMGDAFERVYKDKARKAKDERKYTKPEIISMLKEDLEKADSKLFLNRLHWVSQHDGSNPKSEFKKTEIVQWPEIAKAVKTRLVSVLEQQGIKSFVEEFGWLGDEAVPIDTIKQWTELHKAAEQQLLKNGEEGTKLESSLALLGYMGLLDKNAYPQFRGRLKSPSLENMDEQFGYKPVNEDKKPAQAPIVGAGQKEPQQSIKPERPQIKNPHITPPPPIKSNVTVSTDEKNLAQRFWESLVSRIKG